jgi:hypothetical protein
VGKFDVTARRAAKREPVGFFRWTLPRLDPALAFAGWLDARTAPEPPGTELTCDALAEFAAPARPEEPWILVAEFQIEEWKRLADLEPDQQVRLQYAADALVFAELPGVWEEWKKSLEGWNVRESQQVREWQAEARVEHQRANVLRLLEKRCKAPVPSDLAEAIRVTQDLDLLSRWFDATAEANTFDDSRAATQPRR